MYYVVWMELFFKVRQNGKVIDKAVYLAMGLNSGHKESRYVAWGK
jgi:transposase-like protein